MQKATCTPGPRRVQRAGWGLASWECNRAGEEDTGPQWWGGEEVRGLGWQLLGAEMGEGGVLCWGQD